MRESTGPEARHDERRDRRDDRPASPADDLGDRRLDRRNAEVGIPGGARDLRARRERRIAFAPCGFRPSTTTTRTAAKRCMPGWGDGCSTHRRASSGPRRHSARIRWPISSSSTTERCRRMQSMPISSRRAGSTPPDGSGRRRRYRCERRRWRTPWRCQVRRDCRVAPKAEPRARRFCSPVRRISRRP